MRLLIAGGTGFIGSALCKALSQEGHELLLLSRHPERHPQISSHRPDSQSPDTNPAVVSKVTVLSWDDQEWKQWMSTCEGVINLAGEPIASGRWTTDQKVKIQDSRVQSTRCLVEAMASLSKRPSVFINASAIGYYGSHGDELMDESSGPGTDFLATTCQAWESEARRAEDLGLRVVRLRIGLVLATDGGVLSKMLPPFRFYIGGPLGSGRQWVSWIHRDDVVGLVGWVLGQPTLTGVINLTAPEPVIMREFCRTLGRVLHRPSWISVPSLLLRIGLGEMADLLLTGQRVVPRIALDQGYRFRYPHLEGALENCFHSA